MTSHDDEIVQGLYDLKNLFADKWMLAIAVALRDTPGRPVEILSTIDSYSIDENWTVKHAVLHDSILARTLKKMREQGLVTRHTCTKTFPPESVYTLRPELAELLTLMEPLVAWTRKHHAVVEQAQFPGRGQCVAEISAREDESDRLVARGDTNDGHSNNDDPNSNRATTSATSDGDLGSDIMTRDASTTSGTRRADTAGDGAGSDGAGVGGGARSVRRHSRVPGQRRRGPHLPIVRS